MIEPPDRLSVAQAFEKKSKRTVKGVCRRRIVESGVPNGSG
jgi:hypothetical protein